MLVGSGDSLRISSDGSEIVDFLKVSDDARERRPGALEIVR